MASGLMKPTRFRTPFITEWRFERSDFQDPNESSEAWKTDFDDSGWRQLNLPHDWGIEQEFGSTNDHSTAKLKWDGIGWYRKTLHVDSLVEDERWFIEFDGAMANAQVWLNGHCVGEWAYGYTSFVVELSDGLREGENVVAVRLENPPDSSRWYPGSGLYRKVWISRRKKVSVAHNGVFVTTPEVDRQAARVNCEVTVENKTDEVAEVKADFLLIDPDGESAGCSEQKGLTIVPNWKGQISLDVEIEYPKLWDLENTNLYTARVRIYQEEVLVDELDEGFGVRTIQIDPEKGVFINQNAVRINGVCMHHDLGPLGAAAHPSAIERQVKILKEMGCNSIRTAHNPPDPYLLEVCDRLGMLLYVEAFDCWAWGKKRNDYSRHFEKHFAKDIRSMVERDRNHPSVFIWSIGNEVLEQKVAEGALISEMLRDEVRKYDATRPITVGCNHPSSMENGFASSVDVFGFNYKPHLYESFHKRYPQLPVFGSETASTVSSRNKYALPVDEEGDAGRLGFHVSSYDLYYPRWATTPDKEFEGQDQNPCVFGEYVWTGFDYLGEPTPFNDCETNSLNFVDEDTGEYREPGEAEEVSSRSSYFGILDLCGFPKDRYYLYQSRWRPEKPTVHILPHWNWEDRAGQDIPVHVYTSGDEVELFLNGKSLGRKTKSEYEYRLIWENVTYEPGVLKAVAYRGGKIWCQSSRKTTGAAHQIRLTADARSVGAEEERLIFAKVEIQDAEGNTVSVAQNELQFSISGAVRLIGLCNGDPTCQASFQGSKMNAFGGLCQAILQPVPGREGIGSLSVCSEGLGSSEISVEVRRS
ncbi:MAG: DUF4982 domain-containing protein [Opitutales bacterium]|nr:DUF4982 domain-containing protein [Opitutales bacterium]